MELHFTRSNGPVDDAIDMLMEQAGGVSNADMVRKMLITALKAGQECESRGDIKLMNSSLKEMRFTSKAFGPYRHVRKVTVFGSARTAPDEPIYRMAVELGSALANAGFMIITGAGPGIMQAANEGAGPEKSFGINIRLPFEQRANPIFENSPRLVTYKYFFNRKVAFLKEAHAVALFPGGFGTLDEAMETLTLIQTGKRDPIPLVLMDVPGGTYWKRWTEFMRHELLEQGYISNPDMRLFEQADSVGRAAGIINRFYRRYHGMRYVNGKLVIRMSKAMAEDGVEELARRFAPILLPGGDIRQGAALPDEADEPELAGLPRLLIDFNRKDFGSLRSLIDAINDLPTAPPA